MYRRFLYIAFLFGLMVPLSCTSGEDRIHLEFWAMGREGEVVQQLIPDFEAAHPGVHVDVQQLPWRNAHEKLLTAFAGDATPDVCQLGNTWIPELAALGALTDLSSLIDSSAVIDPSDYFSGVWATNVVGGKTYGVPWYVDTRLLFYRTDILKQAGYDAVPETWAGWVASMKAVKDVVGEDKYAVLLPINEFEPPLTFALQTGAQMVRDDGRYGDFESPAFRKAFSFYVSLFEQGLAPAVSNTRLSNVWQEFARGYFTYYVTGPWNIGEFKRRLPEDVQDDWMTAPMPGPEGRTPGVSMAGGSSLIIFQGSKHERAAWQLVEYLSSPEQQVRFHALTGNLPSREKAWEDSLLTSNPYAEAFREQLRHTVPVPQVPEWERIVNLIWQYAETVVNGRMTVDQALKAMDAETDRILEKRRWMLEREPTSSAAPPVPSPFPTLAKEGIEGWLPLASRVASPIMEVAHE